MSMSFGLSFFQPESKLSKEELVKFADPATYGAKRRGRNQVCVHADSLETVFAAGVAVHPRIENGSLKDGAKIPDTMIADSPRKKSRRP